MRLATYRANGALRPALVRGNALFDIKDMLTNPISDIVDLVANPTLLNELEAALAEQKPIAAKEGWATLAAPIPRPKKNIFCVGRNYTEHVKERGATVSADPVFFTKAPNTVIGPEEPVILHPITNELDYEAELAVVIGRGGRDIKKDRAMEHVFGYTIINDITARDVQKRHQQWFKGKSLDNSCPMGPYLVSKDEVDHLDSLKVQLWVNGELRQQASVGQMIFDIPTIIEVLSMGYTLEPGDIIATGTPSGVGAGFSPPRFLKAGDIVEIEITGLGRLRNPVTSPPTS